jgi:hypothetical protein
VSLLPTFKHYFLSEVGNPTQSGPIRFRRPYLLPVGVLVWVL